MGRIGLARVTPSDPDRIYAIIEANDDERGIYHSSDFGLRWEKRSEHMTTSPQYYNELVVDPSESGPGLLARYLYPHLRRRWPVLELPLGIEHRHVDDHALWIDPDNTDSSDYRR